jgi:hypothetical protein
MVAFHFSISQRQIGGSSQKTGQLIITKEFIRKATHPHPCPLPSRERGLKNRPSLEGRVFKCGFTYKFISKL